MGRCAWAGLLATLLACSAPSVALADDRLVLALAPTLTADASGVEYAPALASVGAGVVAPAEALALPKSGGGVLAAGGLRDMAPGVGRLPGLASFYSQRFHGRPTASGEPYLNQGWTAAHRDLPLGSLLSVTNPVNGVEVVVRVNDRGPFHPGRLVDLSVAAAQALGLLRAGVAMVVIRPLSESEAEQRVVGLQSTGLQRQAPTSAEAQASEPVPAPAPEQTPSPSLAPTRAAVPSHSALVKRAQRAHHAKQARSSQSVRGTSPAKRAQPARR